MNPSKKAIRPKTTQKNRRGVDNVSSSLHITQVTPTRIERSLYYIDENLVRTNAGSQYLVYDLKVNDLFDPDPLILSGSVSGFSEYMAFYDLYRVLKVKLDLEISNNEDFSILWGVVFSTAALAGIAGSKIIALSYLENGLTSGAKILAAKGGSDRGKFTAELPVWKILGNKKEYMADISYTGFGSASPGSILYMSLIVVSATNTNLTNGVSTFLKLGMHSEFFSRKPLSL